jgi:hypothetical protein
MDHNAGTTHWILLYKALTKIGLKLRQPRTLDNLDTSTRTPQLQLRHNLYADLHAPAPPVSQPPRQPPRGHTHKKAEM